MSLRTLFLLSALALPALLPAQQRRVVVTRPDVELRSKDLKALNPARIVRDNGKGLAIEASQMRRLDSIMKAFDDDAGRVSKDAGRFQKDIWPRPLDRPKQRDPFDKPKTKEDSLKIAREDSVQRAKEDKYYEQIAAARRSLEATLLQFRQRYDSVSVATLAVLTDAQRLEANPWLARASEEMTYLLRRANIR